MDAKTLTSRTSTLLTWIARIGSLASVALLAQFVIGSIQAGDPLPTPTEAMGLACFPVGVVVGMLVGWRQPLVGATISLASLSTFYVWIYFVSGKMNVGPYFVLFTLPAFFYLLGALIKPSDKL